MNGEVKLIGNKNIVLKKESIGEFTFFLEIPESEVQHHSTKIKIGVYRNGERIQTIKTKFLGPYQ